MACSAAPAASSVLGVAGADATGTRPGGGVVGSCRPLRLLTSDGVTLRGDLLAPVGQRVAGAVIVHGFSASGTDPEVRALAEALAAHGIEVLTYDARGHGRSGGRSSIVDRERLDVAAAVGAMARPVVTIGVSMGAIAVIRHAAGRGGDGLAGVVVVSAPARWRLSGGALVLAALTRTAPGAWALRRRLGVRVDHHFRLPEPPVDAVGRIGRPLAVVHGGRDTLLRPGEGRLLHDRGGGPRRLEEVAAMGHGLGALARPAVLAAVQWVLATSTEPSQE